MGGSRRIGTGHQLAGLTLLAVFSFIASLAHAHTPDIHRRQISPANEPHLIQRAEDTAPYAVYPKDIANKAQTGAVTKLLYDLVPDKKEIYISESPSLGIFFWSAPLTKSQAATVKANPNVGSVRAQCTSNCFDPTLGDTGDDASALEKRDSGLVKQQNAEPEMRFISQIAGHQPAQFKDYVYDRSAGQGQTVYTCDYGAHLDNPEFTQGANIKAKARWLFAKGTAGEDTKEDDSSITGHGSCMLDKIGGNKYGTAKRVSPVIVKVPFVKGGPEGFLDGVRKVYDDYKPKYEKDPKTATAVLSMSWGYPEAELGPDKDQWMDELKLLLQKLISMGILPVTGSGNGPPWNTPVNRYPQLWGGNDVPELLVVGGVTIEGKLWEKSQVADFVKVYAPAFLLHCADGAGGEKNHLVTTGTSMAAASVSGLAAYFLGLSSLHDQLKHDSGLQRVRNLRKHIIDAAFPRGDYKHDSLWNGVDPRDCNVGKRADGVEVPCDSGTTKTKDIVVQMPGCFITATSGLKGSATTPAPKCVCAAGKVVDVGSTTVSGTKYTWCQTGGKPIYPTATAPPPTTKPAPNPTTTKPAPAPPKTDKPPPPPATTKPTKVPLASQCIHVFTKKKPHHTSTCTTSISLKSLATPLPDGSWTCVKAGLLRKVCYCQAEGQPQPCGQPQRLGGSRTD